jgi:hypothetical protein
LRPVLLGLIVAAATASIPVLAVHNEGLFELDGNAVNDPNVPGIDWADVFANQGQPGNTFVTDVVNLNDNIFTGGGSKDGRDVSSWRWTSGSAPDKDDLEHAYAYLATDAAGNEIVYFGADRFSNSGDSDIGFWFFKQAVSVNPNGTFNGVHSDGDILVVSDFVGGGTNSVINVFEWQIPQGGQGSLVLIASGSSASGGTIVNQQTGLFCLNGQNDNDLACAVANNAPTPAPWAYQFKGVSGNSANFPTATFFEGGVNLTGLLKTSECFSSFLAETRSSASATATLKDFVVGPFKNCSIGVTKTCNVERLTTPADNTDKLFKVDYSITVTNTSDGSLPTGTILTVRDDVGTPDPATSDDQTQTFTEPSPLAKNGTQAFTGSFFSNENGPHNTVYAKADFSGNTLTASNSFDCTPIALNPLVTVTKTCGTPGPNGKPGVELILQNGVLVTQVNVSGTVCNTSTTAGLDLDITVTDDANGVANPPDPTQVYSGTLSPGICADYTYSYKPNAGDGSTSPASVAMFSDTVTAIGSSPALLPAQQPTDTKSAHCTVCPCNGLNCPQ